MRILFLASGPQVPSTRFRVLPWVRPLRADGHQVVVAQSFPQKYDYFPWMGFRPSQLLKRSVRWWHWLRSRLQGFDVVIIEREIFDSESAEMELRFRETCRRLILDLDDAVFLRYPNKFEQLIPAADLVICGNRFIEEWVAERNAATCLLPTCVDLDRYVPRAYSGLPARRPVIGWMGTAGNLVYLREALAGLRQLRTDHDFELHLIVPDLSALSADDLAGLPVQQRSWSAEREIADLQSFDIGLMPLSRTDEWAKYKCGLKLIQYLATGVPGVASAVGVNSEILDHGGCGIVINAPEEWAEGLGRLLNSDDLRQQLGAAGRKHVERNYSVQACYPQLVHALQSAGGR